MLRHWFRTARTSFRNFAIKDRLSHTHTHNGAYPRRLCSPLVKVKAPRRKRGKRRRKYAVRFARASDGRQNAGPSRIRPPCTPPAWQMISISRVTHFIYELFFCQFEIESISFYCKLLEVILPSFFIFSYLHIFNILIFFDVKHYQSPIEIREKEQDYYTHIRSITILHIQVLLTSKWLYLMKIYKNYTCLKNVA